ncbi:MAG: histidine kinase, partial [Saprospiraceae bacterium]
MKKYFMYAGILTVIGFLFYLGNIATSEWKEKIKYRNKLELGIAFVNPGDLYVVQDSLMKKSFFKVIGLTSDSSYCIAYGKDTSILPSDLRQSTILLKEGLLLDKLKNWVAEVLENQDNFNDKLDFLSKNEIDFMFSNNTIHGYDNGQPEMDFIFKLNLQYYFGGPLLLVILLLGLFILFYLFDMLTKALIPTKKYTILRLSSIIFVIVIYSFLNGKYMLFSSFYADSWIGFVYVFLSHVLVLLAFQNISKRVERMPFEEKEIAKFFSVIILGLGCEFIFRLCFDFLLYNVQNQGNYDLKQKFIVFLVVSFKFWVLIASANFFNNLVKYISSLRRKSRQLHSVTSEAMISADALQQSEAHVNTHFLYNSLHAIAALAPVSPDKTETLALSLAKYYRYTTNRNDQAWISIKEDVEVLTAYLAVEKIRMGEKLSYSFE